MRRLYYILIVFPGCLFLFTSIVLAQHNVDSLLQILGEEGVGSIDYVDQLNSTAFEIRASYPDISEKLALKSHDISIEIDYKRGIADALKITGNALRIKGDYGLALEKYLESKNMYTTLGDSIGIANTTQNIGSIYIEFRDQKAIDYLKEAEHLYIKTGPKINLAMCYTHIGIFYFDQEIYDSSMTYYNKALVLYQNIESKIGMAEAHNNIGYLYLQLGDYDVAQGHLSKSIGLWKEINDFNGLAMTFDSKGELFREKGDFEQAVENYKKGLFYADSIGSKYWKRQIYNGLYITEKKRGDFEKAMEYQKANYEVRIASLEEQKGSEMKQIEISYKLKEKENELILANEQLKAQSSTKYFLLVIIAIVVISGVSIFIVQRSRIRKIKQLHIASESLKNAELENSTLREQELRSELEFKNKELTSFTINFIQKNGLLEELKNFSEQLLKSAYNLNEDQRANLNRLNRTISMNLNREKDWEDFKLYFENVHKDFFVQLKNKYPDLTGADLKICAMIRLNLSMKETANIMGISTDSVKKARYRLRKKFDLETEDNLFDFMMEMERVEVTV